MSKEDPLASALREFIEQTEQAVAEGWIYSDDYQDVLRSATKSLPNHKEEDLKYPESSGGFHVLQQ